MDIPYMLQFLNRPKVEEHLFHLYEGAVYNHDERLFHMDEGTVYNHDVSQDPETFFRFGRATLEDIRKILRQGEKPWYKYPLCVLTPLESLDEYRRYLGTKEADRYEQQEKDLNEMNDVYVRSQEGGMSTIYWWILPHMCHSVNNGFLLMWLREAYPDRQFFAVGNAEHTFVQDDQGGKYDLYWSIFDDHIEKYTELKDLKVRERTEFEQDNFDYIRQTRGDEDFYLKRRAKYFQENKDRFGIWGRIPLSRREKYHRMLMNDILTFDEYLTLLEP